MSPRYGTVARSGALGGTVVRSRRPIRRIGSSAGRRRALDGSGSRGPAMIGPSDSGRPDGRDTDGQILTVEPRAPGGPGSASAVPAPLTGVQMETTVVAYGSRIR